MKKPYVRRVTYLDYDDISNPLLGAGQAIATLEVGKRLAKNRYYVEVLSSKFPGYKDRTKNGITYRHIGIATGNVKLNNMVYILILPWYVRKLKADVIVECFSAPISTLLSPLFTKIPVIGLSTMFEAKHFAGIYHVPVHWVERIGCRFYKYFIALSKHYQEKMLEFNPKAMTVVIPEGVDAKFFAIKKKQPKHILFLGRLDMHQKGIDLLLEAYALIANKVQYPLVIAGHGADEQKLKAMVNRLGLNNKVTFIGSTYGKKKAKTLSESLFVAMPSRNETFSCFALEALAAGLPLVTFDIPGLAWTSRSVALKAPLGDVRAYANQLLKAIDPKRNDKMSIAARSYAKKFTWEAVVIDYDAFFTKVLQTETEKRVARTSLSVQKYI